ncbi:MAG: hypothetical protein KatS3mg130_1334 [Candidatus Sumerlaea sp.]|nr:MAG: hypothetical protein KatS3mg130_1334 [Candidatus Sumerlaea sp.]
MGYAISRTFEPIPFDPRWGALQSYAERTARTNDALMMIPTTTDGGSHSLQEGAVRHALGLRERQALLRPQSSEASVGGILARPRRNQTDIDWLIVKARAIGREGRLSGFEPVLVVAIREFRLVMRSATLVAG